LAPGTMVGRNVQHSYPSFAMAIARSRRTVATEFT
jgi:hypothetical protein